MTNQSSEIKKLTPYEHLRLRTEMYFGSRVIHTQEVILYNDDLTPEKHLVSWVPALYTYFREILDNACDEVISHKHGNSIWVSYDPSAMTFSVEDNGRGIPIEWDSGENAHKATMALSQIMTGRNFDERETVAGANGIGASGTNFCSANFRVQIARDGQNFDQEFLEGDVLMNALHIKKPKISKTSSKVTGTKIVFRPSKKVFTDMTLPEQFVKSRIVELAICNPHIKVFYNDVQIKVKQKIEQNLFKEQDFIDVSIADTNFASRFFILPNWHGESEFVHSIVNNIPAFNGGSHVDAFQRAFAKGLLTYLERESRKRKLSPNSADVQHGLLIFNTTVMNAPNFDSQSKTRLINESAGQMVRKYLIDQGDELFKNIVKKNKAWIEQIYERCAIRTQRKDAGEIDKLTKKLAKAKVPKLLDANGRDRSKCVILLTEGESAKMGVAAARNPEIHAALDLRGKVMNVNGTNIKDVLGNAELRDIMNSVGLTINVRADRRNLRYGQIWLAHDMDLDGANIGALLINFFHTYWPELFDPLLEPFIYVFQTPYIIGKKGSDRKYWYGHNYHEFDSDKVKGYSITRAKGLGALEKLDWQYSLAKPELISIVDDGNMKETLDMIFHKSRADDRKAWMSS